MDTLAQIANDAVDELDCPVDAEARRVFERMQILVEKAAEEASAALVKGDELMAALTKHLQARRANQGLGDRHDARDRPALTNPPKPHTLADRDYIKAYSKDQIILTGFLSEVRGVASARIRFVQ